LKTKTLAITLFLCGGLAFFSFFKLNSEQTNSQGEKIDQPFSPKQLFFVHGESLKFPPLELDVRNDFLSISARAIVSTSEFIASEFGNQGIFFRHQLRL